MTIFQGLKKGLLRGFILGTTLSLTAPCLTQERTVQEKRMEQLSKDNRSYFRQLNKEMLLEDYPTTNQKGEDVEIKELIRQSVAGPYAQTYAKNLAETMWQLKGGEKYETLEQKIALAKETIDQARQELQRKENGGLASYTLGYEYDKEKKVLLKDEAKRADYEKFTKSRPINSTQTFDEFLGPKEGRIFYGDCEDFSMALTTLYHALQDYSSRNEYEEPFFDALAEGLRHYKIVSIEVPYHALNMSITLGEHGPSYDIIEPQNKKANHNFILKDGKPFITYQDERCKQADNKIIKIYSREFSAKVPETGCGCKK